MKGRWYLELSSEESLRKATAHFKQAVEKYPDYAPAYAGLARSYTLLPGFGHMAPREVYPKAKEAARKALEIDPTIAEAYLARANIRTFYEHDWAGAEEDLKRAIELNPGDAIAHYSYAIYLALIVRFDESILEIDRALELDPLSLLIAREAGMILLYAARYDRAIDVIRRGIKIDKNYPYLHLFLALAYFEKSDFEKAMVEVQTEIAKPSDWDPTREMMLGTFLARLGREDEAQRILHTLLEQSKERYVPPTYLANLFFILGDYDSAFEWLDKAYEERDLWLCFLKVWYLDTIPEFRTAPRYVAMLKKIGLDK